MMNYANEGGNLNIEKMRVGQGGIIFFFAKKFLLFSRKIEQLSRR